MWLNTLTGVKTAFFLALPSFLYMSSASSWVKRLLLFSFKAIVGFKKCQKCHGFYSPSSCTAFSESFAAGQLISVTCPSCFSLLRSRFLGALHDIPRKGCGGDYSCFGLVTGLKTTDLDLSYRAKLYPFVQN